MLFLTSDFYGSPAIAHVNLNGAFCSLDQNIVLRPMERGALFQYREALIRKLHVHKQHIVLIPKRFPLMYNVSARHGSKGLFRWLLC